MPGDSALVEVLVLITDPAHAFSVLAPLERRGLTLVGLKTTPAGEAVIAVRGSAGLCARGSALCDSLRAVLPAGAPLRAAASLSESFELLRASFGPRELVQWEPNVTEEEEPCEWVRPAASLLGAHNSDDEAIWLSELVGAPIGSALGLRFCAQMRRDGFARLLVGPEQHALYAAIEDAATRWFCQDEEVKEAQAGVYAHINRKFTGYRNGKFREQLELRQTRQGSLYPQVEKGPAAAAGLLELSAKLSLYMRWVDAWARAMLRHIAHDVGAPPTFFDELSDPQFCAADPVAAAASTLSPPLATQLKAEARRLAALPLHLPPPPEYESDEEVEDGPPRPPPPAPAPAPANLTPEPPELSHSLVRACRYDSASEGVYGSGVLCEAHNDVGFLTFDPRAAMPGLHALRRSDNLWVPVEEAPPRQDGALLMLVMAGDTLGYLTRQYYAPSKHRVTAPPSGERIGLPFLFRGRSDAVLNTLPAVEAAKAAGRPSHLAEMETTTIKELPAFDSARSILRSWFGNRKGDAD